MIVIALLCSLAANVALCLLVEAWRDRAQRALKGWEETLTGWERAERQYRLADEGEGWKK